MSSEEAQKRIEDRRRNWRDAERALGKGAYALFGELEKMIGLGPGLLTRLITAVTGTEHDKNAVQRWRDAYLSITEGRADIAPSRQTFGRRGYAARQVDLNALDPMALELRVCDFILRSADDQESRCWGLLYGYERKTESLITALYKIPHSPAVKEERYWRFIEECASVLRAKRPDCQISITYPAANELRPQVVDYENAAYLYEDGPPFHPSVRAARRRGVLGRPRADGTLKRQELVIESRPFGQEWQELRAEVAKLQTRVNRALAKTPLQDMTGNRRVKIGLSWDIAGAS